MHHRLLHIATAAAVVTLALAAGSGPLQAADETAPPASTTPPAGPISVMELAPGGDG